MQSFIAILLVTAMVVVIPFAKAHKVADLIRQFKTIFQWYLKYRMIESNSASRKADAIRQALVLVGAYQLHTDTETNFVFGLIDIDAFVAEGELHSQLQTIFRVGDADDEELKYPMPSRVFKNIAADNLTPRNSIKLSSVKEFLRRTYAAQPLEIGSTTSPEKGVALEFKLVEAADLSQQEDTSPMKQYMLCMLGVGTKA